MVNTAKDLGRDALWSSQTLKELGAVGGLIRTAIEHAQLFFGDRLMECQRLGLEVAFRHIFRLEVVIGILAAHQRRPIPLAHRLFQSGRDIADGQADAPVVGPVGLRSMEQQHVMQRRLAGLQLDKDRLGLVHLDGDLLTPGQKIVLVEGVLVLDLLPWVPATNFMQPETLLAGDIAIQAVATSDELSPQ